MAALSRATLIRHLRGAWRPAADADLPWLRHSRELQLEPAGRVAGAVRDLAVILESVFNLLNHRNPNPVLRRSPASLELCITELVLIKGSQRIEVESEELLFTRDGGMDGGE